MAAVMVDTDAGLVHTRHKSGTSSRADRRGHKRVGVEGPFTRQLVEVGGLDERVAITGQVRRRVFGDQPKNVRALGGG